MLEFSNGQTHFNTCVKCTSGRDISCRGPHTQWLEQPYLHQESVCVQQICFPNVKTASFPKC